MVVPAKKHAMAECPTFFEFSMATILSGNDF